MHGHGEFWLRILGISDALVLDHCYLRGHDVEHGDVIRTYYVRVSTLDLRRPRG